MSARWWTLVVWALAAASALFWGLKLFVTAPAAPPHTQTAEPAAVARGDLTRLLGADAPPPVVAAAPEPAADARFQLIGVVSPRSSQAAREGLALIAVDGRPPKAFRVGAVVEGQSVLQAVSARGATLGPRGGAAVVALNIAAPPPAATGMLPPAGGFGPPAGGFTPPAGGAVPAGLQPPAYNNAVQGPQRGMPQPQFAPTRRPVPGAQDVDPPQQPGTVPVQSDPASLR